MGGVAGYAWMIQGDFGNACDNLGLIRLIGREFEVLRRRSLSTIKIWYNNAVEKPSRNVTACISFRKVLTFISEKGWR